MGASAAPISTVVSPALVSTGVAGRVSTASGLVVIVMATGVGIT